MTQTMRWVIPGGTVEKMTGVRIDCGNCGSRWVVWRVRMKAWLCRKCGFEFKADGTPLTNRTKRRARAPKPREVEDAS